MLALAARLRRETTVMLRWNAGRLQDSSWNSLGAKLHRWRKTHDSPDNAPRLEFDPWITSELLGRRVASMAAKLKK
jgi:hypothetical protein